MSEMRYDGNFGDGCIIIPKPTQVGQTFGAFWDVMSPRQRKQITRDWFSFDSNIYQTEWSSLPVHAKNLITGMIADANSYI